SLHVTRFEGLFHPGQSIVVKRLRAANGVGHRRLKTLATVHDQNGVGPNGLAQSGDECDVTVELVPQSRLAALTHPDLYPQVSVVAHVGTVALDFKVETGVEGVAGGDHGKLAAQGAPEKFTHRTA